MTGKDLPLSFGDQAVEAWEEYRYVASEAVIESISTERYRVAVAMTLEEQARYAGFGQDVRTFQYICEDQ